MFVVVISIIVVILIIVIFCLFIVVVVTVLTVILLLWLRSSSHVTYNRHHFLRSPFHLLPCLAAAPCRRDEAGRSRFGLLCKRETHGMFSSMSAYPSTRHPQRYPSLAIPIALSSCNFQRYPSLAIPIALSSCNFQRYPSLAIPIALSSCQLSATPIASDTYHHDFSAICFDEY